MRAVQHTAELVIGAAIAALLTIAALIAAGRWMGPAEYGDFSAALAVIYLVALALSPVIPTVARVVAGYVANGRLDAAMALRRAMLRIEAIALFAAAACTAIAVWPLARWLHFRSVTPLVCAFLTAFIYVILSIDRGFLQGLFRFRAYNANTVLESALRAALIFTVVKANPSAGFAMGAWLAGSLAAQVMALLALQTKDEGATVDWREFIELLKPMIVLMIALAVFQNTDMMAVKRWMRPEVAGAYGAASALTRGFGALFVPLYALAGPLLTKARNERASVSAATLRLTFAYVALTVAPLIVVTLWPRAIVTLLFGERYAAASAVFAPLCGITMLSYVGLMLAQGLITVGRYRFVLAYAIGAIAEIVGLALHHGSYRDVLTVLYVCQGATLGFVIMIFLNSQNVMREGSKSSSA